MFSFLFAIWLGFGELGPCDTLLVPPLTETESSVPRKLYPEWWGETPLIGPRCQCRDPGSCVKCHPDNKDMDSKHAFSCNVCHLGNPLSIEKDDAHAGLVIDPGSLDHIDLTCGRCHPEHADHVKVSNMALAPRLINHTRFAFGSQNQGVFNHGVRETSGLNEVPFPHLTGFRETQPSNTRGELKSILTSLCDDLLRRSCLRCHLYTRGSDRVGEQRGQGCSACHVPYSNRDSNKPQEHAIVKSLGMTPCLKCHNSNHIGCDYVGLFEKDFNRGFSSPIIDGAQPMRIYGSEQHTLRSDIHFRRGLICSNCHPSDQLHGKWKSEFLGGHARKISCEGCHVNFDHPLVARAEDDAFTLTNRTCKLVPVRRNRVVAHDIDKHKKLQCSACHAGWSFQDYGFHLMLDERAEYWMWSINSSQNDPQIQALLNKFVGDYAALVPPNKPYKAPMPENDWTLPVTKDWLSDESRPGAWFRGFTMRRWANPPLGLDPVGKVSVMRPMRQYVISWVKADGSVMLDSVIPTTSMGKPGLLMNPYSPHTIQEKGKQCHECHGNPKSAGLGECLIGQNKISVQPILKPETRIQGNNFRWDAMVDQHGRPVQSSSYLGAGPLDRELFMRLLFPGSRFRGVWSQYLEGSE
ncbi:MAG: hypothetical protein V1897_05035 [Pseudomonadota bacterium]